MPLSISIFLQLHCSTYINSCNHFRSSSVFFFYLFILVFFSFRYLETKTMEMLLSLNDCFFANDLLSISFSKKLYDTENWSTFRFFKLKYSSFEIKEKKSRIWMHYECNKQLYRLWCIQMHKIISAMCHTQKCILSDISLHFGWKCKERSPNILPNS